MLDLDDLTDAPSGGLGRQIFVGLVLALSLGNCGVWSLVNKLAWVPAKRGHQLIHGEAAFWIGLFYLGIALFMHFHWFWGLVPAWRISQTGKLISCLIAITGLGRSLWLMIF